MGIGSNWAIEVAEEDYRQRREDWIRRELDNSEADEDTSGWEELEEEYDEIYANWDEYKEDEYEWHISQNHSAFYIEFLQVIKDVKKILRSKIDPLVSNTIYKMIHVHVVTAMETYLGDALKSAVISNRIFIENAAKNLEEFTRNKYTLSQILEHKDGIKKIVLDQLNKYLYHDIPKVLNIYNATLGTSLRYNISEIAKNTKIRHDIVHRNGKTIDGKFIDINNTSLVQTISEIEKFVKYLDNELVEIDTYENT
jgi:hypothetical protein